MSHNTIVYPAKWTQGKRLRIRDKYATTYLPMPESIVTESVNETEYTEYDTRVPINVDEVEFIECKSPEYDLRTYNDMDLLIFRKHKGPVRVYFPPNLRRLVIDASNVICMTPFPESLTTLIIRETFIMYHIAYLPNLLTLTWDSNTSPELPILPTSLKNLHCTDSCIERLPDPLPPALHLLICRNCKLTQLPPLPPTLEWLRCHNMDISTLPTLPANLYCLDFQHCNLTHLPPLPKTLDELDVRYNKITHIPEIPAATTYVNIIGNPVQTYPYIYRKNIWIVYDYNSYATALNSSRFMINARTVFSPLHMLKDLDVDIDQDPFMDIYEDDGFQLTLIRRLQVMCEIQTQVACRAFLKTIKEELMMRTWHPSRVEAWCGVDFGSADD